MDRSPPIVRRLLNDRHVSNTNDNNLRGEFTPPEMMALIDGLETWGFSAWNQMKTADKRLDKRTVVQLRTKWKDLQRYATHRSMRGLGMQYRERLGE